MSTRNFAIHAVLSGLLSLLCLASLSQGKESSSGILYGEDHAFAFQAPRGWVLDNHSAVREGLDAVFYPVGQTWVGSPVIAYCRARPRTNTIKTAADVVHDTLVEFRHNGNLHSKANKMAPISITSGRTAQVYYYTGDKHGSYEAAAYIVEAKTINFFILNTKQKSLFYKSLPAFQSLVKSYTYMGDHPLDGQKPEKSPGGI